MVRYMCGIALPGVDVDVLSARLPLIRAHLDERAWRLLLGAEAKILGRGGIKVVAAAVEAHPDTAARRGCVKWATRMGFLAGSGARRCGPARGSGLTPRCGRRWMRWWIW